jgi:hypothetical protein
MEDTRSSETSDLIRPTRYHVPEDGVLQSYTVFRFASLSLVKSFGGQLGKELQKYIKQQRALKANIHYIAVLFSRYHLLRDVQVEAELTHSGRLDGRRSEF